MEAEKDLLDTQHCGLERDEVQTSDYILVAFTSRLLCYLCFVILWQQLQWCKRLLDLAQMSFSMTMYFAMDTRFCVSAVA